MDITQVQVIIATGYSTLSIETNSDYLTGVAGQVNTIGLSRSRRDSCVAVVSANFILPYGSIRSAPCSSAIFTNNYHELIIRSDRISRLTRITVVTERQVETDHHTLTHIRSHVNQRCY